MFQTSKRLGYLKKLVLVLTIFALMTNTSKEATLKWVPYIRYPVQFRQKNEKNKDKNKDVRVLRDLGSKVNAMHPAYTMKLGLYAKKIEVGAQKIDKSHLDIFEIVIADCSVKNKFGKVQFF